MSTAYNRNRKQRRHIQRFIQAVVAQDKPATKEARRLLERVTSQPGKYKRYDAGIAVSGLTAAAADQLLAE